MFPVARAGRGAKALVSSSAGFRTADAKDDGGRVPPSSFLLAAWLLAELVPIGRISA